MSIHRVERAGGERFVVRNRDAAGVNRARAFVSRVDAERYQQTIDAAKADRRHRELDADRERY